MNDQHLRINSGDTVVFFGDSITAANPGYVSFIKEMIDSLYPEKDIQIVNRGVGGNTVKHLLDRVSADVIAEKPDWVSIKVGVNDCNGDPPNVDLGDYEAGLHDLVHRLQEESSASVIVCSPSIITEDPQAAVNVRLRGYAEAARRIARAHNALYVPVHEVFLIALKRARATTGKALFTTDGVHMNQAGNTLLGMTWLKSLGAFSDLLSG